MTCWYDIVAFLILVFTAIICTLYIVKNNRVRKKTNTVMKKYKKLN